MVSVYNSRNFRRAKKDYNNISGIDQICQVNATLSTRINFNPAMDRWSYAQ